MSFPDLGQLHLDRKKRRPRAYHDTLAAGAVSLPGLAASPTAAFFTPVSLSTPQFHGLAPFTPVNQTGHDNNDYFGYGRAPSGSPAPFAPMAPHVAQTPGAGPSPAMGSVAVGPSPMGLFVNSPAAASHVPPLPHSFTYPAAPPGAAASRSGRVPAPLTLALALTLALVQALPGSPFGPHLMRPSRLASGLRSFHRPSGSVPPETAPSLSLAGARHAQHREYTAREFLLFQNVVPPLAGTQYRAVDQGTATPRHMRATMYNVPELETLRRATKLPVAVTVRPFAPVHGDSPVPVVDMLRLGDGAVDPADVGPPRCNRCRTYINPLMMHTPGGRFLCNICQFPNSTVPQEYACAPDPLTGQRADRLARPELHRGVYDIVVPPYYRVGGADNTPQGFHHVVLVDISQPAVTKQIPVLVADALRAALFQYDSDTEDEPPAEPRPVGKVCVILFDKHIHFLNLAPELQATQLCVSGDLDDPFVPFDHGLFADPDRSRLVIEDAMNHLELLVSDGVATDTEPAFAVALRTAAMCLERVGGGKVSAVLASLPSWGPGRSTIKENRAVGRAGDQEALLFAQDSEYYKLLEKDMLKDNVGLSLFVVANTPTDLGNIGRLASATGGAVHRFANFLFERDGRSFIGKLVSSIRKCTGYQGQLKLRCLNGLQVAQYYGFPAGADPVIPVLDEDQTFTVLFEYDGQLNTKFDCHFQAAILYTDLAGVRKVRVINLVLAVSERLEDIFNFVDLDAVVTTIARDTLSFMDKEPVTELRKLLTQKLVDVFAAYRLVMGNGRNSAMSNQLIFPDSLKHLPSYFLSLLKNCALRDSSTLLVDARLAEAFLMLYMPVDKLVYHLYPALVELHTLQDEECMPEGQFMRLPEFKPLTAAALENSVYILCNGTTVYVRVHPNLNELLLQDLFGDLVRSIDDVDPYLDTLPELTTHISEQARNLVAYFHEQILGSDPIDRSVVMVRDGVDPVTQEFRECLVEDRLPSRTLNTAPNMVEFLASVHQAVKVQIEADVKPKDSKNTDTLAQRMIHF